MAVWVRLSMGCAGVPIVKGNFEAAGFLAGPLADQEACQSFTVVTLDHRSRKWDRCLRGRSQSARGSHDVV